MPKRKTRRPPVRKKILDMDHLHPALQQLQERLSSPRLKAAGTIYTYLNTGQRFLDMVGDTKTPTESDWRQYFIQRRRDKISERTLRKEFFQLKKLAQANGWPWVFTKDDTPLPEDEAHAPALMPEMVNQLILAKQKLSKAERFYLAVSTTWACRREELSRIQKRDYDDETILIHTAKHGRPVKHLIPPQLKQVFADYRPKEHSPNALTEMFGRICSKAGLEHHSGNGWHSIRRTVTTVLEALLPTKGLSPALVADYTGWSKRSLGRFHGGADMIGVYRHPEILDTDPFGRDRLIYEMHPFLPFWGGERQTKLQFLATKK